MLTELVRFISAVIPFGRGDECGGECEKCSSGKAVFGQPSSDQKCQTARKAFLRRRPSNEQNTMTR